MNVRNPEELTESLILALVPGSLHGLGEPFPPPRSPASTARMLNGDKEAQLSSFTGVAENQTSS